MALAIPFATLLVTGAPLGVLGYLYAMGKRGENGATPMAESGVRAELNQALRAEYAAFAAVDRAAIVVALTDEMTAWKNEHPQEEAPTIGSRALQATGALLAAPIALPIAGVSLLYSATKAELKRRSDAAAGAKAKAAVAKSAEEAAFMAAAPAREAAAVATENAVKAKADADAARSNAAIAKLNEAIAASEAATAESNRKTAEAEAAQADVQRTANAAAAAAAAEEVAAQKAREAADAETARAEEAKETQAAEEAKAAAAEAAEAQARAAADRAAAEAEAKAVPFANRPLMKPKTFRRPSVGFESQPLLALPPSAGSPGSSPIAAAPPELQTASPAAIAFAERNAAAVESGGPSAFGQAYPDVAFPAPNEAELLKEVAEEKSLAAQAPSQTSSEPTPDAKSQETCEPTVYLERRKALIDALENRARFRQIPRLWSKFVDNCLQGDSPPMPLSREWRAAGQDVVKQKAALVNLVATLKTMGVLDDTLEDKIVSNWMTELGGRRRRKARNSTFRRHRKH